MATIKDYPLKLNRFKPNSCVSLYYSKPYSYGVYNGISLSAVQPSYDYIDLDIDINYNISGIGIVAGSIFSSGIICGEVITPNVQTSKIRISKDSFVTLDDRDEFIDKWNGVHFNFETLSSINSDSGNIKDAVKENLLVNKIKRVDNSSYYSQYNFLMNKDYYYEIEVKNVLIRDEYEINNIINSNSFVLKAEDESVVYPSAPLSNDPLIIGGLSDQPYYGGLQNNIYYRAELKDSDFEWTGNRFKGKLTFIIRG